MDPSRRRDTSVLGGRLDVEQTGIVGTLFDFSFSSFISTRMIKLIYAIGLIWAAIVAISFLIYAISSGGFMLVVGLLGAPIVFFIGVFMARVYTEFMIVIFRIAEDTHRIADVCGKPAGGAAAAATAAAAPAPAPGGAHA